MPEGVLPSRLGCEDTTQGLGLTAGDPQRGHVSRGHALTKLSGRQAVRRTEPPPAALRLSPAWPATAASLLLISFPARFPKGIQAPRMNDAWPSRVAWGEASPPLACCPHPGHPASVSSPV